MTQDDLGLENGQVVLVPSSKGWSTAFEREAFDLKLHIADRMRGMEHVGSTSISGIRAKPILDIMLGVSKLVDGLELVPSLSELGYQLRPSARLPGEHVFAKGAPRTHLLHMVEYQGEVWQQKLAFRDALRENPHLALSYEKLKVELATRFADDRASYTEGKTAFVRDVVRSRLTAASFHTRRY